VVRKLVPLAALAVLVLPAPAAGGTVDDARKIRKGLTRAVADGRLDAGEANHYRMIVRRSRAVLRLLPYTRRVAVANVLHDVAAQAGRLTRPRALALFSMLQTNANYLAVRPLPRAGTDIAGRDGVIYRAGWGGLHFHPLANFGWLNGHVSARRDVQARRLARALAARAVSKPRGIVWEYYFGFGGGRPPWTSGMAQAVAAQALMRAAERFDDPDLHRAARRAYRSIPGRLVMPVSRRPWIRLYSFSRLVVLNAQLQAALSLASYARTAGDARAAGLAVRLRTSAAALLRRFDTGFWSRYSLGRESPLKYHVYVVSLLKRLAAQTEQPVWTRAAARFERYLHEPPKFKLGGPIPVLYPVPAEGFRDVAPISFWLSKMSTVTLRAGGTRYVFRLGGGWHTFRWYPGRRPPRTYRPTLAAVDLAGNRAATTLRPVVVRRDTKPPDVRASVTGRRLAWRAVDPGTPWLDLRVRLRRGEARKRIVLGRQPLSGAVRLRLPRGRWNATLVAFDSARNYRYVALGTVPD
jgi:hypothetical protein